MYYSQDKLFMRLPLHIRYIHWKNKSPLSSMTIRAGARTSLVTFN